MYCQSCGVALSQQMKYCNRCGANLITVRDDDSIKLLEKRMDSEMEGLFWVTVFFLGLIVGGMALLKKVGLSESLIVAYMVLGTLVFIVYFALGLWQVRRLSRSSKEAKGIAQPEEQNTNELDSAKVWPALEAGSSVTEQTTRGLDRVPRNHVAD